VMTIGVVGMGIITLVWVFRMMSAMFGIFGSAPPPTQ